MSLSFKTSSNEYYRYFEGSDKPKRILLCPLICFQNFARIDECEEANRHCERLNQKLTDQEQKAVVLNDRYTPNEPVQNFVRMKEYS